MDSIASRLQQAVTGRYRIIRELGRGGMAIVYLADDLKHGRQVAVKVLLPEIVATVGAQRFAREIQVAATLQHPHVLGLYDSDAVGDLLFYVMPFVEGESLRDRLRRERQLPVDEALRIVIEVCDALAYAHGKGVVHRDIKPENILLAGGHALVADFGIALGLANVDADKLTQTGISIGTPTYMSPEQALGDQVGPTSDVYSLGCVIYEMLVGEPPFSGPNQRAIMARHAMEPVPSMRLVRETIPAHIEDAVRRCLHKLPADRPQSAAVLATALSSDAQPTTGAIHAAGDKGSPRTRVMRGTHGFSRRALTIALAIAAVSVLWGVWRFASGGGGRQSSVSATAAPTIAVLYFESVGPMDALDYVASGLTTGLISALSEVPGLNVVSPGGVAPFRGAAVSRDSIARALHATALVTGYVEAESDSIRTTVRLLDDAAVELDRVSFKWPITKIAAIEGQLVDSVARLIRLRLGRSIQLTQSRSGTRSTDAWASQRRAELYQARGDSLFQTGDDTWSALYRSADSLATLAEDRDDKWPEPAILRGQIAYQRSRRAIESEAGDPMVFIDSGLVHAAQALRLAATNPDALELRGTLKYWRWLIGTEADSSTLAALIIEARADLEQAVKQNPTQAGAWATLSHLYYNIGGKSGADIEFAARKALESDMYLSNANVIMHRLFLSAYDDGRSADAARWCSQGAHRFPKDFRFSVCQLRLLSKGVGVADVARARKLADSVVFLVPSQAERAYRQAEARILVGTVMARAGQRDSAKAYLSAPVSARVDPSRDAEYVAHIGWLVLGDSARALASLRVYYAANPRLGNPCVNKPNYWYCTYGNK